MPHYSFHIRDGSILEPDEEGVGRTGARRTCGEVREAARAFAQDTEGRVVGQSFDVSDSSGQLVLVYPFNEAFLT